VSVPEWWTDADAGELDVLVWEFTGAVEAHWPTCAECQAGPWCTTLRDALEVVLAWKRGREFLSRAAWLREQQTLREREVARRAA